MSSLQFSGAEHRSWEWQFRATEVNDNKSKETTPIPGYQSANEDEHRHKANLKRCVSDKLQSISERKQKHMVSFEFPSTWKAVYIISQEIEHAFSCSSFCRQ